MSFKGVRARLLNGQVVAANLAPGSVTPDKLGGNGSIPSGITLPPAQLENGALPAGVLVALEQLGGGQLPPDIAVALAQLGGGTLPNNIDVEAAAIIGTLVAGQIAAGAITAAQLTVSRRALTQRHVWTFDDLTEWRNDAGAPYVQLTPSNSSLDLTGGYALRLDGGTARWVGTVPIPFDPNALYRVSCRIKQLTDPTAGGSNVYVGLAGLAADGTTYVNNTGVNSLGSQHYVGAAGATIRAADGWHTFTGYLSGWAAAGVAGTTSACPQPTAPGVANAGIRYVVPIIYANYNNGNGQAILDSVAVEVVPTGVVTADELVAGAVDGKTITGALVQTAASGTRVQLGGSDPSTVGLIPDKVRSTDATPIAGGLSVSGVQILNNSAADELDVALEGPAFTSSQSPAAVTLKTTRSSYRSVTIGGTLVAGDVQISGSMQYNVPRLLLARSADVNLPSGAVTTVTYDSTPEASLPGFTQSGGVITAGSTTGTTLALVTLQVTLSLTPGTSRAFVELVQAGSRARTLRAPFGTGDDHAEVTGMFELSALDTLVAHAYQNSGSATINITEAYLTVVKLGQ